MSLVTKQLLERLQQHYIKPGQTLPGGVFVPECGWNDAGRTLARADALYIGFTSASGRILIGHELKVSRQDWRHELDQPGKADPWHDECHAWYVVAPSTAVVPVEELPDGWGLLVPNPRSTTRMNTVVKARVHSDRNPSWKAMRSIVARLDTLRSQSIQDDRDAVRREAAAEFAQRAERLQNALPADAQSRLWVLDKIEAQLGGPVSTFGEGIRPEVAARALQLAAAEHEIAAAVRRPGQTLQHAAAAAEQLLNAINTYSDTVSQIGIPQAS